MRRLHALPKVRKLLRLNSDKRTTITRHFYDSAVFVLTPVYAEPNRERSEAHKMAVGHARNGAKVWLRHDTLVMPF